MRGGIALLAAALLAPGCGGDRPPGEGTPSDLAPVGAPPPPAGTVDTAGVGVDPPTAGGQLVDTAAVRGPVDTAAGTPTAP